MNRHKDSFLQSSKVKERKGIILLHFKIKLIFIYYLLVVFNSLFFF